MKNKEFYDLSKIRVIKSNDSCCNKIWKIFYETQEGYWNTEPIAVLDREGVSRVQVWGEWAEMEHVEPKFKVGDYVFYNGTLCYAGNRRMKANGNGYEYYVIKKDDFAGTWNDESLLTLSLLDEKEHDFLQYLVDHIRPKFKSVNKCLGCTEGKEYILIETITDECIEFPYFGAGTMYKGMKYDHMYTLAELGLKEPK